MPGPLQAPKQAVRFLIYSLATPGSLVISTACLFVFDGCQVDCGQAIWLQQPQPFDSTNPTGSHPLSKSKVTQWAPTTKGQSQWWLHQEGGGQRERKEEESLSREAASKVARQAGQQFCLCERFARQRRSFCQSLNCTTCVASRNDLRWFAQFGHFSSFLSESYQFARQQVASSRTVGYRL